MASRRNGSDLKWKVIFLGFLLATAGSLLFLMTKLGLLECMARRAYRETTCRVSCVAPLGEIGCKGSGCGDDLRPPGNGEKKGGRPHIVPYGKCLLLEGRGGDEPRGGAGDPGVAGGIPGPGPRPSERLDEAERPWGGATVPADQGNDPRGLIGPHYGREEGDGYAPGDAHHGPAKEGDRDGPGEPHAGPEEKENRGKNKNWMCGRRECQHFPCVRVEVTLEGDSNESSPVTAMLYSSIATKEDYPKCSVAMCYGNIEKNREDVRHRLEKQTTETGARGLFPCYYKPGAPITHVLQDLSGRSWSAGGPLFWMGLLVAFCFAMTTMGGVKMRKKSSDKVAAYPDGSQTPSAVSTDDEKTTIGTSTVTTTAADPEKDPNILGPELGGQERAAVPQVFIVDAGIPPPKYDEVVPSAPGEINQLAEGKWARFTNNSPDLEPETKPTTLGCVPDVQA